MRDPHKGHKYSEELDDRLSNEERKGSDNRFRKYAFPSVA